LFENLIPKAILILIFLLIAFPVHEFAHAFVAYQLGDGTAKLYGRLTLNPVAHFDPIGGLLLVVSVIVGGFVIGWAKPTPTNPSNFRDRRNGEVIVALAGPASNLIMASLAALVVRFLGLAEMDIPSLALQILILFVAYNVALAIFNMIPIPPLDGSTLLFRVLNPRTAYQVRATLGQYGFVVILLLIFAGGQYVSGLITNVTRFLVGA
jgi:Zn-dependent protease